MALFKRKETGFRIDPSRAVYVLDTIDGNLVAEVTPRILELRADSNRPIYVIIDSPGGVPAQLVTMLDLLRSSDGEVESPTVITVGTGQAASAAADLLCAGHLAVAYPSTIISFHGVRYRRADTVTEEAAVAMQTELRETNTYSSEWLASKVFSRVLARYGQLSDQFAEFRADNPELFEDGHAPDSPRDIDLPAFAGILHAILDEPLDELPLDIGRQVQQLDDLTEAVDDDPGPLSPRVREALDDYEDDEHKKRLVHQLRVLDELISRNIEHVPEFDLDAWALTRAAESFDFIAQSTVPYFRDDVLTAMTDFPETFFNKSEWKLISKRQESDLDEDPQFREDFDRVVAGAYERAAPLWSWTLGLCRRLHHGEFDLNAREAWMLGLIDHVIGWDPAGDD